MSVESDKDRQPRGLPSFQYALGFLIAITGGGIRFYEDRFMHDSTILPVAIGQLQLLLSKEDVMWISDAVVVFGALLFFTAPKRG